MSDITASIVLHNTAEAQIIRLLNCISSSSIHVRTYVVDNSPIPLDYPCLSNSGINYRRDSNRGYGAGHNNAIRAALEHSDFHFVLNPDIHFGPSELATMIRFMEQNPNVGQLMPKILYPDGSLQYLCKLLPTPADLLLRRFPSTLFRESLQRRNDTFELRFTGYDRVMDVPYLSGCFMLFRAQALRKVGLFDERFFMYPEDIDITRRIHREFRTVFCPYATVIHDHAKASYKSRRALWIHIYNCVKYFNKWGWFRDSERSCVNRRILRHLRSLPEVMNSNAGVSLPVVSREEFDANAAHGAPSNPARHG